MRRLLPAFITVVALAAGLHSVAITAVHAAAAPRQVVVFKQYGAALHTAASSDAPVDSIAACGTLLSVSGVQDGWYRVLSADKNLWVGGARVADAAAPPDYDCSNAVTYQVDDWAVTNVPSGCLSQRDAPSRGASFTNCVDNGTLYQIKSGPVSDGVDDWFQVWSPQFGDGWMLAQYLLPSPPHA